MRKWPFIVLPLAIALTAVVTWFASLYVFERPVFGPLVEQGTLASAVLGEQRDYLVHLPESYQDAPDRRYPVVFVLDGSSQDLHTAASAALMARIGVGGEVVVVGIPNVDGKGRQRDYTPPGMRQDLDADDPSLGGGDRFLAFLREELIPHVEQRYRVTGTRLLAGNSRGGLFVVYALTAEPGLFDAYLAHSPALWRDEQAMVGRLERFLDAAPAPAGMLFLSLGSAENDRMQDAFRRTEAVLRSQAPPGLRWHAYLTSGAHHGNNAVRATPVALRWAFDRDWDPGQAGAMAAP